MRPRQAGKQRPVLRGGRAGDANDLAVRCQQRTIGGSEDIPNGSHRRAPPCPSVHCQRGESFPNRLLGPSRGPRIRFRESPTFRVAVGAAGPPRPTPSPVATSIVGGHHRGESIARPVEALGENPRLCRGRASRTTQDSCCPASQNVPRRSVCGLCRALRSTRQGANRKRRRPAPRNWTRPTGLGDVAVRALDDVNVEFERGRFTAVMGPSGSGKSTLMHCMAGLDRPTVGARFRGRAGDRTAR